MIETLVLVISNIVFLYMGYKFGRGEQIKAPQIRLKRGGGAVIQEEQVIADAERKKNEYLDQLRVDPRTPPPEDVDISSLDWDKFR